MKKNNPRIYRISQAVQVALAQLIEREIKDPRLGLVTITSVDVTPDLSYAKIYVVPRAGKDMDQMVNILNKASKFLRHRLAKEVQLRIVPILQFRYDTSFSYGEKMDELLKDVSVTKPDEQPDEE
jgi:ribosome-binding factor A